MTIAPGRARGGPAGAAVLALVTGAALLVTIIVLRGSGAATQPHLPVVAVASPTTPAALRPPQWTTMDPESAMPPPALPALTASTAFSSLAVSSSSAAASFSFVAVAGNGCATTPESGAYATFPAGSTVTTVAGGWTGKGCTGGGFWSVPMSGKADRDDEQTSVIWWFATSAVRDGTCAVWVFVPKPAADSEAAGNPTYYQVLHDRSATTVVGSFAIDQRAARGSWTFGGTFPVSAGKVAIRLVNRGVGAGTRHAGAQVQVGCTPG